MKTNNRKRKKIAVESVKHDQHDWYTEELEYQILNLMKPSDTELAKKSVGKHLGSLEYRIFSLLSVIDETDGMPPQGKAFMNRLQDACQSLRHLMDELIKLESALEDAFRLIIEFDDWLKKQKNTEQP